jgi:hypothetical protein
MVIIPPTELVTVLLLIVSQFATGDPTITSYVVWVATASPLVNEQELLPQGWHCSRVFVSGGPLVGEEEGNGGPLFEDVLVNDGGKVLNVDVGGEGITIVVLDNGVLVPTHNKLPFDNSQSKPARQQASYCVHLTLP